MSIADDITEVFMLMLCTAATLTTPEVSSRVLLSSVRVLLYTLTASVLLVETTVVASVLVLPVQLHSLSAYLQCRVVVLYHGHP